LALVPLLDQTKKRFSALVHELGLGEENVQITVATLSAREAIGSPNREDYALLEGTEVMIEAEFRESFGQAFTDQPKGFHGQLKAVLGLNLDTKHNRAIFIATVNAVMAYQGMVTGTRHCRDEEPEECAAEIAENLLARFGKIKIGLVGYQPAILEHLVQRFGADNMRCTDLNPKNAGSQKFGVEIWDGRTATQELIQWSDLVFVTSSTMVNNTFDEIRQDVLAQGKHLITFGVTGAGVSALTDVERLCFRAH
jgi:uncharacterized protein (DUF4213/DUF364 family)